MNRMDIYFMKKFLLMLLILFLCGIISADLCIEKLVNSYALLDIEMYEGYANANLTFQDVFWNILYERAKLVCILILLCFTPIKERISVILICVFSFAWGFFCMSSIAELGMAGIVVGIGSVLPHGLLYGGIVVLLLIKKNSHTYYYNNKSALGAVTYIAIVFMFIAGCILESLMGTHFIPWVIRLGLI